MYNKSISSISKNKKSVTQQSYIKDHQQYYPSSKIVPSSNYSRNHIHNQNKLINHSKGYYRKDSTIKNRQNRVRTDYDQSSYQYQHYPYTSKQIQKNKNKKSFQGKIRQKKSFILGNQNNIPRRGKSFNIQSQTKVDSNVESTKNNLHKNLQLKTQLKSNKPKQQVKNLAFQHPIIKYFSNKNKYGVYAQPISSVLYEKFMQNNNNGNQIKKKSPYERQISKFEQIYAFNNRASSTSKQRRKIFSTNKRSQSNGNDEKQTNLNKANIKVQLGKINHPRKNIKAGISNRIMERQQRQKKDHQFHLNSLDKPAQQQQEQITVQTIKKNKGQLKNHLNYTQQDKQIQQQSYEGGDYGLTQEQQDTFGDRFPYGFQKVKLLGRGGFSLVWLGKHIKSGKLFAIKQIITQSTHQTHIKQIWFGTMFFMLGGIPKPQFSLYQGIKNLVRMYSYEMNQTDTWIFYEKCGLSLGSALYDIKSQKVYGQQRLYKMFYKNIYKAMPKNPSILRDILKPICQTLALLSDTQIVHSDLKTENILIKYEENNFKITEVKLIDYGSSFEFKNISQFSMATPEYMPPQILNYIIHENQGQYEVDLYQQVMQNYKNPWVVDMWSLGCVMLEMIVGVPLWMSLPLLVPINSSRSGVGSYLQKQGLFAVTGRLFPEIIKKQRKVVGILDKVIKNENYSKIVLSQGMIKIIKGMLQIDFTKRISPTEVIKILQQEQLLQK